MASGRDQLPLRPDAPTPRRTLYERQSASGAEPPDSAIAPRTEARRSRAVQTSPPAPAAHPRSGRANQNPSVRPVSISSRPAGGDTPPPVQAIQTPREVFALRL